MIFFLSLLLAMEIFNEGYFVVFYRVQHIQYTHYICIFTINSLSLKQLFI